MIAGEKSLGFGWPHGKETLSIAAGQNSLKCNLKQDLKKGVIKDREAGTRESEGQNPVHNKS